MKKMLLLTAALIAALAGPALAQDRRGGDGRRGPEATQTQRGGGDFRGGQRNFGQRDQAAQPGSNRGGGQRDFGQRQQAAQPGFNRGGGQRSLGQREQAVQPSFTQRDNATRDFNRSGASRFGQGGTVQRDFNRGAAGNRSGFRGNDNRPGFGQGNDRRDFGRYDGRRDYGRNSYGNQRYSQYYRSFNAQRRFRIGSYYGPSGYNYRRWSYGDFLPSLYWSNRYWLNDYYSYDLTPPMPGTVWVRYGDDALLIDQYTGEVIQVAYGIFW